MTTVARHIVDTKRNKLSQQQDECDLLGNIYLQIVLHGYPAKGKKNKHKITDSVLLNSAFKYNLWRLTSVTWL